MGTCNTTQNERGGKDLLLKICETVEVDVGTGSLADVINFGSHDLPEVGDLVRFTAAELGTADGSVTAGDFYFVKSLTATGCKIAATPTGSAITFGAAHTDMDIELFRTIGGLRSPGFSFASEGIDISNHGSNQWKKLKDGAGMRSASISGSGVYTNSDNFQAMKASAKANELVCLAFIDVTGGVIESGCFKITSLELTGEYDGEANYSMSAESSGEVETYP